MVRIRRRTIDAQGFLGGITESPIGVAAHIIGAFKVLRLAPRTRIPIRIRSSANARGVASYDNAVAIFVFLAAELFRLFAKTVTSCVVALILALVDTESTVRFWARNVAVVVVGDALRLFIIGTPFGTAGDTIRAGILRLVGVAVP